MLDLSVPVRAVEGVELAADAEQPLVFYVLPPPPRVAIADGQPQLALLRFVRNGELTGGHFRVVVELSHPGVLLKRVRTTLADTLRQNEDRIEMRPCPVEAASAELLFVGRETTADGGLTGIVGRGYGRTTAQSIAPFTAAFSVTLTPDGVRLLEAGIRSAGAPMGIVYRLQVEGLWPAQRVRAHVDWGRVYDHFSIHLKEGALLALTDIQRITEELVENRAIRIDAVQGLVQEDGSPPLDVTPALQWIQRDIVEKFCEPVMPLSREPAHASLGTVGELFGVGTSFAAKRLTQIERATADVDFQVSRVLARTLNVQTHLADLLGGASAEGHILDADPTHPFFERMTLDVRTSRPLAEVHAAEIVLRFGYGTTSTDARLTPDAPRTRFETWANLSPERTWTLQPEVTFDNDSPFDAGLRTLLAPLTGQGRELTLDLDRMLGLRRIEVRAPVDPRVLMTTATLTRYRGAEAPVERELSFPSGGPPQIAWFRDSRAGDRIEVSTAYILTTGRLVKAPAEVVDTSVIRLPPPFPGELTVQLIADDDWTDLEKIVVSIQKAPDLPAGVRTFDRAGAVVVVNLHMPDPTDRSFRYRVARVWTSGASQQDDWVDTDVPVVIVGRVAADKLVVDVSPIGPELPSAGVLLIEVDLSYIDAEHQVRDVRKVVLRALADTFRWEVNIKDPGRRNYEYRQTVHRMDGTKTVGPWTRSASRLLVIPVTAA